MSVSTKHPLYEHNRFIWRSVRDAIEGTAAVKRAHEVYLPMPTGMLIEDEAPAIVSKSASATDNLGDYMIQNLPWYHPNPAYMAYLQRARFPEIASHTLRGMVGVATKQEPEFELNPTVAYLEEKATMDGSGLIELYAKCVMEVLATGRLALTLDVDTTENKPYLSVYTAETVTNWNTTEIDGEETVTMVVLEEKGFALDRDGFTHQPVTKHRVLRLGVNLDDNGEVIDDAPTKVTVEIYIDDELVDSLDPSLQGKSLKDIPIVFAGAVTSEVEPGIAPMLGVSEIAYSIYRKDADLSNGEFLTCNPTLYMTGATPVNPATAGDGGSEKVLLGSNVLLKLSNPAAKVDYTKTDTAGLGHVQNRILALFNEAAEYGASMLGPTKKGVEATEALKMRQADTGATLVGVSIQVSNAITKAIHMCENWIANKRLFEPGDSEFEGNTEFAELGLTSQDIQALVTAWMSHGISHETLLHNFKDAGIIPEDRDIDDEMEAIEDEMPDEMDLEGDLGVNPQDVEKAGADQ